MYRQTPGRVFNAFEYGFVDNKIYGPLEDLTQRPEWAAQNRNQMNTNSISTVQGEIASGRAPKLTGPLAAEHEGLRRRLLEMEREVRETGMARAVFEAEKLIPSSSLSDAEQETERLRLRKKFLAKLKQFENIPEEKYRAAIRQALERNGFPEEIVRDRTEYGVELFKWRQKDIAEDVDEKMIAEAIGAVRTS